MHRAFCECCEHGSCKTAPTDCPSSTAFTFTQPAFAVDLSVSATGSASVASNLTMGNITCTDGAACFLDLTCYDCELPCAECDPYNYSITTIPCILRKCDGTDCTSPMGNDWSWEWNWGTTSGQNIGLGSEVQTLTCGTKTWAPCSNTMIWLPQVVDVDLNPSGSGGAYWEYSIIWWLNLFDSRIGCSGIGEDPDCLCGVYKDECQRTGGNAWQQIVEGSSPAFFWRTGTFLVRKENDSCFRATWNGTSQTASGSNVISIVPPPSGGNMGIQTGAWNTAVTGTCTMVADSCYTCVQGKTFSMDTGDDFYTSFGGTGSWSLY